MTMFLPVGLVAALVLALCLLARTQRPRNTAGSSNSTSLEETGRRHATYLPVIRQAMASSDFEFLACHGPHRLVLRARRERQRVAMLYLAELHTDFESLLRLARVIAVLSPQVGASRELERLRMSLRFSWHYRLVALGLYSGPIFVAQISGLSRMVAELAARMESAMRELGERAAVAARLASSLDRRRLDLA